MTATYTLLSSGRVARDRALMLARGHVAEFTRRAMNRRLRAHGIALMRELDDFGSFCYRFNFSHAVRRNDTNWARLRAYEHKEGIFKVFLDGPSARDALQRVNEAIAPKSKAQLERRKKEQRIVAKRKQRVREKQHKLDKAQSAQQKPAPYKKRKDVQARALLTLGRNKVKPKFKHSRDITWYEAVRAVVQLLEVRATPLITSQERADYRLRRALERNKLRFTSITKDGFTICFRLVTNWRGDLTMLRIEFTSDNKHPLYRRVRDYFKQLLLPKSRAHEASRLRLRAALEADMLRTAA